MIAVIIPTLNEEEAIEKVIDGFPDSYNGYEVEKFVVDGGSTDSTVEKAEEAGATVIEQRLDGGKGNGLSQVLDEVDAEFYVMIDGDATYDPGEFGKVVDPVLKGEAEHVIGWRKNREKGSIPLLNKIGNRLFNLVTRTWTGKSVHDMLSGYRAFTKKSLKYTDLTRPGFGIETEMTFTALENHVPIEEVEISYREREGDSKLHPIKDGWRIINTLTWSIRDMSPLSFFSIISITSFLLAAYPASIIIHQKLAYGQVRDIFPGFVSGILIILGVQFLIFGLLADQIKNLEKRIRNQL